MPMLHAFIDESGDDGFSLTSTKWLVLAATVLYRPLFKPAMENWKQCKLDIGRRENERIHWKKLDHPAKKALLRRLVESDFKVLIVVAHKPSLTSEQVLRLKCPTLYCFLTKLLVERLSWLARDQKGKINITFEDRPQVKFDDLHEYIFRTLRKPGRNTQLCYDSIDGFNCKHVSHENRLEIADSVVSAVANGLNPDAFGDVETSYALSLLPKIWARQGNLYSYGLKTCPKIDRTKFRLFKEIDEARK